MLPRLGNASVWTLLCLNAVPDPDPEIRGGGGGGSSRPWDKGGARSPKNIFRPFEPQFGLNIRGGGGGPGPGPSSETAAEMCLKYSTVHCVINCIVLSHFSFMFVLE